MGNKTKKLTLVLNIILTVAGLGVFGYGLYLFSNSFQECTAWGDNYSTFVSFVFVWIFGLGVCRFIFGIWSNRE